MALIGEMRYLQIGGNTYEIPTSELPIASSSTLGGIKVGTNLSIDSSTGVLSASFTETDPVFSASAAAGISSTDITNWNSKVSDTGKWNDVSLNKTISDLSNQEAVIPFLWDSSDTIARFAKVSKVPSYNCIAQYNNGYLNSTTPSANDNSTKVATTAYVDAAIPTVSITQNLTSGTKSATINIDGTDYDIYSETNTDTKVMQIPLNGVNANHGLLFSLSGSTQTTIGTVYTSNKISYSDYTRTLYIYNSDRTKYGYYKFDSLYLANSTTSYSGLLKTADVTANRTYTLPDATGTIALTSDIHSIPTGGTAGQFLVKSSSTDYDAAWGAVDALPSITSSDNNKVLMVVNGAWAAASLPIYNGGVS